MPAFAALRRGASPRLAPYVDAAKAAGEASAGEALAAAYGREPRLHAHSEGFYRHLLARLVGGDYRIPSPPCRPSLDPAAAPERAASPLPAPRRPQVPPERALETISTDALRECAIAIVESEADWLTPGAIADRLRADGVRADAREIDALLRDDLSISRHPLGAYRQTVRARAERRALAAAAHAAIVAASGPLPGTQLLAQMEAATDWTWSRLTTSIAADVVTSDSRIVRDSAGQFRLRTPLAAAPPAVDPERR